MMWLLFAHPIYIKEVLKREDIDIVYIASPPWLHVEHCCQVMESGKAVLCEKPMTLNYQDAVDIAYCARKNHVFCAEGIWSSEEDEGVDRCRQDRQCGGDHHNLWVSDVRDRQSVGYVPLGE